MTKHIDSLQVTKHLIDSLQGGEYYVYHSGFLMKERNDDKALHELANYVLQLYADGHVLLTQRRTAEISKDKNAVYEYRVVKRRKQGPVLEWSDGCLVPVGKMSNTQG